MGKEYELSPEQVTKVFENSRKFVIDALGHPIFTKGWKAQAERLLNIKNFLDDQAFDSRMLAHVVGLPMAKIPDELKQAALEEIAQTNGVYLSPYDTFGKPEILIRRSYVAKDEVARYYLQDLFAEEFGHSVHTISRLNLHDLKDDSYLIVPFNKVSLLADDLREYRRDTLQMDGEIDFDRVSVVIEGFITNFFGQDGVRYPGFIKQRVLEEFRSSIIQTMIEAAIYGMKLKPNIRPDQQLIVGLETISNNAEADPLNFLRETGSLIFINSFRKDWQRNLVGGVRELLSSLATLNIDQFVEEYHTKGDVMVDALLFISGDFDMRGVFEKMRKPDTSH